MTLDVVTNKIYDIIAIPVIQFIICNYIWNSSLYNRKGGRILKTNMNELCCDCDIKRFDGGNTCISQQLLYNYVNISDVVGKLEDDLEECSFLIIQTSFFTLSFGNSRNVYGGTHENTQVDFLKLCEYIAEGLELILQLLQLV